MVIYIVDGCIYLLTFDIETLLPCLLSGASSLLGATSSTICTMIGIKRISITSAQSVKKNISAQTRSMVFSTNKVKVKEGKTHKKRSITCARGAVKNADELRPETSLAAGS